MTKTRRSDRREILLSGGLVPLPVRFSTPLFSPPHRFVPRTQRVEVVSRHFGVRSAFLHPSFRLFLFLGGALSPDSIREREFCIRYSSVFRKALCLTYFLYLLVHLKWFPSPPPSFRSSSLVVDPPRGARSRDE